MWIYYKWKLSLFFKYIQYIALSSQLQYVMKGYFCIYKDLPSFMFLVIIKFSLTGHWFEKNSGWKCTDPESIQPLFWSDHCKWQPRQSLWEATDCYRETEAGTTVGPN